MSSVVCLHEPHRWTKSIKIHPEMHACVSVRTGADASGDLRKVMLSSIVLHASCLKSATVGNTQNVDDLYCVTLQRRSETHPKLAQVRAHTRAERAAGDIQWGGRDSGY